MRARTSGRRGLYCWCLPVAFDAHGHVQRWLQGWAASPADD